MNHPLRNAVPLRISRATVETCLDPAVPVDQLFRSAWMGSLGADSPGRRRGALPGVIGHVAESVVELMLVDRGFVAVAHHPGPGRHGVDLLMLHLEAEMLFAVEVKGTLVPGRVPRLSRGELRQMSREWVDKPDNPAMMGWRLGSQDVYGALAAVNFADMTLRVAFTADFVAFSAVRSDTWLRAPIWLAAPATLGSRGAVSAAN
jgi:hypothetical protein